MRQAATLEGGRGGPPHEQENPDNRRILLTAYAIIAVCFLALLALRDWNARQPLFLGIYLTACAAYGAAALQARRGRFDSIPNISGWILLGGIALRLIVFWCPPTLSEDVFRYAWDGRVQNAGFGPYDFPPQADELQSLRDEDYQKINHKDFRTAYPPAAELLFRALASVSGDHRLFKLVVALFDCLLLFLLRRLLAAEGLSPALLLVYAWHPLAALEFAANGHMDAIAICLMFLSFLLLKKRPSLAGAALGAAVLTKYLPAVTLPWTIGKGGWKMALCFIAIIIVLLLQYYTSDLRIFRGLFIFYRKWWFNDSVFGILRLLFGSAEPARLTGAAFALAAGALCLWKRYSGYRSVFLINAVIIVFAPVVHPWYVCWLIPFLVFHRNPAWLFFTCWIATSYLIRTVSPEGIWQHVLWLRLMVYTPLYAWLLRDGIRMLNKDRS